MSSTVLCKLSRRIVSQGWLLLATAAWAGLLLPQAASGQTIVRVQSTPISAASLQILVQSEYLRAQGAFLASSAEARHVNAEAAQMEMDNAVKWVNTYFERRRLNREYREAENPGVIEQQEKRRELRRRILEKNLQESLGTDLTDELNWMLRELLAHASYSVFMSDHPMSLLGSQDNLPLSIEDKRLIRVNEGKVPGGKSLVFGLDPDQVLEPHWPLALRGESIKPARDAFEAARDRALGDLKISRKISEANQERLMKSVDHLSEQLNAAWPQERRRSPQDFLTYLSAKRYLQTLAVSTYRLIETDNPAAFDDSYRFRGETVGELLQHMMNKGLEFAPPEAGGEAVYRKLFNAVRTFYLQLAPEPSK